MRISLHADAWGLEGPIGRIVGALLSRDGSRITDVVLHPRRSDGGDRLVPIAHVVEGGPQHVRIDLDDAEVRDLEPFLRERLTEVQAPPPPVIVGGVMQGPVELADDLAPPEPPRPMLVTEEAVPPGERLLHWHARVVTADGSVARLEHLEVDEVHRVRALVVRTGRFGRDHARVPLVALRELQDDDVELRLDSRQLRSLRSDPGAPL